MSSILQFYIALIKCGLSQCLSVQCTSFQRARNSGMKASSSGDFSSAQGQRCHEISYVKTPKQKLCILTVSLYTRDLRVWADSETTAGKEEMRPQSGDWSKLHLDQEWSCSLSKWVSPRTTACPRTCFLIFSSAAFNHLPQKATWKGTAIMPADGQQWFPSSCHPLAANSIKCLDLSLTSTEHLSLR